MGKDVLDKDHMDNEFYFGKVSEREDNFRELVKKINEVQSLGCIVKNTESGLVFLCWKYSENRINFWHEINDGFKDRKHIKQPK